ncbi:alpha/beta hydrolase domain-containing protein 17A [Alosa pseudoharengus]|uniref:alpha/beta hydrolase domain-containing protein 17A n=1 Tax=Alosa pseudoharengus TaxID=34774 RepID=UPI003F897B5E
MNGLSVSELCCLFCCPPCPSRIAAKLAFLPPEPTYALLPDLEAGPAPAGAPAATSLRARGGGGGGGASGGGGGGGGAGSTAAGEGRWKLHLTERAEFQYSQRELDATEVFLTRSSRGNRVGCMYIRCAPSARFTILFSHGNAVDLGQMSSFYIGLGTRINCNIFSYDYSGYGVSTGKPSEKNLYADIDAAWQALRTRYGISPENIILYGQSIGTVPTVDLASRYECAAVVLHSPLTSGMRVAFPDTKKTYCFDAFPNIEKVSKITSPVLIIHGTEDEVIDFSHGLALFERCPKAVEPLWVEGAGHNDIELYSQYLERLRRFIGQELAAQHT